MSSVSKENPLVKKMPEREEHLQDGFNRNVDPRKAKRVATEESTNIRVSKEVKDELNAIVAVKKLPSVNVLMEELLAGYREKLREDERELVERLK